MSTGRRRNRRAERYHAAEEHRSKGVKLPFNLICQGECGRDKVGCRTEQDARTYVALLRQQRRRDSHEVRFYHGECGWWHWTRRVGT